MSFRWVILQHTLSKESKEGLHFDLLLEDKDFCRSWQLSSIPLVNGPPVAAIPLPTHKLYWLDREESEVSGGRGWAKRILSGYFQGDLPLNPDDCVLIEIYSATLNGQMQLENNLCQLFCSSNN